MTEDSDLAALIGSRICHDLISPIGAIGNGIELLMMEGRSNSPEIALISDSVAHANARIRFFRVAFGASSPGQRIGAPEVSALLADVMRGSRLGITWDSPPDLPRVQVKAAFLALLCLETAMPYGGRVAMSLQDGWRVTASAERLRIEPGLWDPLLAGQVPQTANPGQVHFTLLADLARRLALPLQVRLAQTGITMSF